MCVYIHVYSCILPVLRVSDDSGGSGGIWYLAVASMAAMEEAVAVQGGKAAGRRASNPQIEEGGYALARHDGDRAQQRA